MDVELKPDDVAPTLETDDQVAKRKRRFARVTESFKKRAEASERRWLAGLGGVKPKR